MSMTQSTSKRLTIFEGPDGCGKTTAAKEFAELTGASYVHFPALPHVKSGLARMYVEAMMPAILGHQDVVFDRCWLSELPYGTAYREGELRLGPVYIAMLERLAMRCSALVVNCVVPWDKVVESFRSRSGIELLDNEDQLKMVYDAYIEQGKSAIPTVDFDYTTSEPIDQLLIRSTHLRTIPHPLVSQSAGNLLAKIILVGESFAHRKDHDAWYQWPFASFSQAGCSGWITNQLMLAGVRERSIFWINADQDLSILHDIDKFGAEGKEIYALGFVASKRLTAEGIEHTAVSHPQWWKRFRNAETYELIKLIWERYNDSTK